MISVIKTTFRAMSQTLGLFMDLLYVLATLTGWAKAETTAFVEAENELRTELKDFNSAYRKAEHLLAKRQEVVDQELPQPVKDSLLKALDDEIEKLKATAKKP